MLLGVDKTNRDCNLSESDLIVPFLTRYPKILMSETKGLSLSHLNLKDDVSAHPKRQIRLQHVLPDSFL